MTLSIATAQPQYALTAPAHRFVQGGRYVYTFSLELEELNRLFPERVDDHLVSEANRQLTPSHAKNIQDYLEKRADWVLGTFMLGVNPEVIDFQPYPGQLEGGAVTVGELSIMPTDTEALKIFDGQHRRRAIKGVLAELAQSAGQGEKLDSLKNAAVPVMLYAEGSVGALRQMFADASKTRTIERNAITQFDRRDAFNVAADSLCGLSDLFGGRVEMERASVSRSSQSIISINQLAAALKTTVVGYGGRVSAERNNEYFRDIEGLIDRCLVWSEDFLTNAREEYESLVNGEVDNSEIPEHRNKSLAYNATVMHLLAGCYYEWTKNGEDWKPLADFIRQGSLKPGSGYGALLVDAGVVLPGSISPVGRQAQIKGAIGYIVSRADGH